MLLCSFHKKLFFFAFLFLSESENGEGGRGVGDTHQCEKHDDDFVKSSLEQNDTTTIGVFFVAKACLKFSQHANDDFHQRADFCLSERDGWFDGGFVVDWIAKGPLPCQNGEAGGRKSEEKKSERALFKRGEEEAKRE